MRKPRNLLALGLAVLLAACLGAAYWTREAGAGRGTAKKPAAANQPSLIDDRLLQTARQMAALADTDEEQDLAREALRQADHELDQAYATALREAAEPAPKNGPPASVPVQQATARIAQLKTRVAAGQARIAQLSKQAADEQAADQLELVKAQLELDQNDLEDAQEDLIRLGGDRHSRLERALQEHESAQHDAAAPSKARGVPATATLWDQARVWFSLGSRNYDLHAAEQQAAARASELDRAHDALESKAARPAAAAPDADASSEEDEDTAATVARLRRLSDQRKTLAELDRRIQDGRQLAAVYQRWSSLVETRSRGVLHLLLRSLAVVFAILLAALLLDGAIRRAFRQSDRRRLHQLRIISGLATQLVAVVFVLLIVFGPPTQLSTILGLLTAGLRRKGRAHRRAAASPPN